MNVERLGHHRVQVKWEGTMTMAVEVVAAPTRLRFTCLSFFRILAYHFHNSVVLSALAPAF